MATNSLDLLDTWIEMLWGGLGEGWRSDWTPDLSLSELSKGWWCCLGVDSSREGAVPGSFGNFSGYLCEAILKEPNVACWEWVGADSLPYFLGKLIPASLIGPFKKLHTHSLPLLLLLLRK